MPGNICNYIWVYSTYRAIYFPADSNFKLQKRCTISYFFFFGEPSQGNLRHPCPFYASVSLSLSLSRSLVLSILGTGFSFWRAPCGLVLSLRNPVPSTPSTQYPVTTLQDPQSLELGSFCARKHEKRNAIWHTRDSNWKAEGCDGVGDPLGLSEVAPNWLTDWLSDWLTDWVDTLPILCWFSGRVKLNCVVCWVGFRTVPFRFNSFRFVSFWVFVLAQTSHMRAPKRKRQAKRTCQIHIT